jgi:predicted metal-dependent hydrolase
MTSATSSPQPGAPLAKPGAPPSQPGAPPTVPDGIDIVPRKFIFRDLASIPKYWFGGNKLITHLENTFSILIPPGERFFIQSVRNYADRVDDPEFAKLVQAFIHQEGHHTRAHNEFNAHLASHGIDVAREEAYAAKIMERASRWLPQKIQLGITVFFEHLTATGAHMLFAEPEFARQIHPEALRFWRWHAAEELEHKAVAFDLLRRVGGGYMVRMVSALMGLLWFGPAMAIMARRMIKADTAPMTDEMRAQAKALNALSRKVQTPLLLAYFKPSFHPWDQRDEAYVAEFYASPEIGEMRSG